MPSTTQYVAGITQLDGGLDLANPKQAVSPGSLSDCMNVEVAERVGYKSVDGIERHDGRIGPSAGQRFELISIVSIPGFFTLPTDVQIGDTLSLDGEPWAIVQSTALPANLEFPNSVYTNVYVFGKQEVEISDRGYLMYGVTLTNDRNAEVFSGSPQYFIQQNRSALDTAVFQQAVYEDVHDTIDSLPNGRRAHGLHWFKDRLYAVVNTFQYPFTNGQLEVFANDLIQDIDGNTALIRSITLTDGAWDDDDAEGVLTIVSPESGDLILNNTLVSVVRPITGALPALVVGERSVPDESDSATFWRTTEQEFVLLGEQEPDGTEDYGWNPVDMGYIVPFEDGSYPLATLPSVNRRNADGDTGNTPLIISTDPTSIDYAPQTMVAGVLGAIPPFATPTTNITWTGTVPDDVETNDTDYLIMELNAGPTGALGAFRFGSPVLRLTDFPQIAADIPVDAAIEGVEFQFLLFNEVDPSDNANITTTLVAKPTGLALESGIRTAPVPQNAISVGTQTVVSIGGPDELWGQERITQAELAAIVFGIDFQTVMSGNYNQEGGTNFDRLINFNEIKIKVYYSVASPRVYFWDGVDDVSGLISNVRVEDGSFPNGTASGELHIYDLTPEAAAVRRHINPDDEIRTSPNGGGNLIALVNGAVEYAFLPSLNAIVEQKSRYQMITANYYANDAWDAIYGVSGAGRAFVYDQQYFRYIYTGLGDDLDLPRHVEFHIYHLALGYKSGSVLVSVVGEPENYSGIEGAFEISTGDRVTGLLSLPGTMLGIGCQSSTWGLAGATVQNFQLQSLRPKEGVIEYTFVDIGMPIACSNTGITVFSTTPAYGDFINEKMSYSVYPFLYPRLYKQASRGVNQRSVGVICGIPIRTKGQYLVFFQDGYVLCMSLRGGQQAPQFTFRRYHVFSETPPIEENIEGYLTPIAHTSQNDSLGRERTFVSHFNQDITQSNANTNLLYPFEIDRGWSFANDWFPWNYTTNWNYVPAANPKPNDFKVARKAKLYGLSYGISHMSYATSATYDEPSDFRYDLSLPAPRAAAKPQITMQQDLTPYQSKTASIADRGEFFSISVRNQSPEFDNNIERILPPVVSQVLLQEYDSAREGA